jgi:preprotein translocase subunit SecG
MYGLLLGLHLLVCLGLVAVVLVQSGKGGGLAGGAFGGTAQTVFGGRGATDFITRATMVLGGAFFVTSLVLALLSSGAASRKSSLIQEQAKQAVPTAPAPAPQRGPAAGTTQPGGAAGSGTVLPTTPGPAASPAKGVAPAKGVSPAPASSPAPAGASSPKPPGGGP